MRPAQFLLLLKFVIACCLLTLTHSGFAALDLQAPMPVDPALKVGHLKNGLTYYIKKNEHPKQKIELRLVVKFGSLDESDEQLGAAHFIEHLAFKHTLHFKNDSLRSKLEAIGLKYGRDLNAFTEYDLTRYEISLPNNKKESLQMGLQALADFAGGVEFRSSDIAGEEAIILEEQRLRDNLDTRILRATHALALQGTKYPARSPIGVEAVRKNFTAAMLQQLYREYYRPDHMAVMIVGDVDALAAEKIIAQLFSAQKNPPMAAKERVQESAQFSEPSLKVFADLEQSSHQLELMYSVRNQLDIKTIADFREALVKRYFVEMMKNRLASYNANYIRAGGVRTELLRNKKLESLKIEFAKGGEGAAIDAAIGKLLQVQQYGFFESELQEQRQYRLNAFEQSYLERNKISSSSFIQGYLEHFLYGDSLSSVAQYWELMQELHPNITLAEVNAYAKTQLSPAHFKQILYLLPKKDEAGAPSKADLLNKIAYAEQQQVKPLTARTGIKSLMKTPPATAGTILSEKENPIYGTTELSLSNGVTVIFKKTDFTNNKISMFHQSHGGSSLVEVEDSLSAVYAPDLIRAMGFDDLSPRDVQEFMQPKSVSHSVAMTPFAEMIFGNSSTADIETLLQLNYQRISNPSKNKTLFSMKLGEIIRNLQQVIDRPEWISRDQYVKLIYNNNPRAIYIPRLEEVEIMDMNKVIATFDRLHSNFYGRYFVFVGNVDLEIMRPLVKKYLANLPGTPQTKTVDAAYPLTVKGIVKKEIFVGKENKAQVQVGFSGSMAYTEEERLRLTMLTDILQLRLLQSLREEKHLIYVSGVTSEVQAIAGGRYQLLVTLPCAADQVDAVTAALFQELERLQSVPVTAVELSKVKKAWGQKHKESLRNDAYWASQLLDAKLNGQAALLLSAPEKLLALITTDSIKRAANQYLDKRNYVQLVVKPENMAKEEQAEISAYKKFVPRDLGMKVIDQAHERILTMSVEMAKTLHSENDHYVLSDRTSDLQKIRQTLDSLANLTVSTCLMDAKQTQLELAKNLFDRISIFHIDGMSENVSSKEIDIQEKVKMAQRYVDLLDTFVKTSSVLSTKIDKCKSNVG